MNKKRFHSQLKIILIAVVLLSVMVLGTIFYRFKQTHKSDQTPLAQMAAETAMTLGKVHQTATKNGQIQWELNAESAKLMATSHQTILQSPQVVFFLEDGSRIHLTAQNGQLNKQSKDINVSGNVRVTSNRYILTAKALTYRHDQRILFSDEPVKIVGNGIVLQANTMRYDLNTNQAHFIGLVEGNLHEKMVI